MQSSGRNTAAEWFQGNSSSRPTGAVSGHDQNVLETGHKAAASPHREKQGPRKGSQPTSAQSRVGAFKEPALHWWATNVNWSSGFLMEKAFTSQFSSAGQRWRTLPGTEITLRTLCFLGTERTGQTSGAPGCSSEIPLHFAHQWREKTAFGTELYT